VIALKKSIVLATVALALGCGGGSGGGGASGGVILVSRTILSDEFDQPMQYIADPTNVHRAYVLERAGRVRVLIDDVLQPTPVLDISGAVVTFGECGLAGMTFAPDFATSRAFYLYYNTNTPSQLFTRVTRFAMANDGLSASGGAGVFKVTQPYENHKGGTIHFGGDGFLYLAMGDGGSGNDPENRAQDPTSLLGKMLRIDPSGDDLPSDADNNYRIPTDNPFVGTSGVRGEIWAFGFRNPFRWCVDPLTSALVIADVGQGAYEEIDYEPGGMGGRNYGWRVREGLHPSGNTGPLFSEALTSPFLEYDHSVGLSIIGGYIYRSSGIAISNRYLFADYVSNHLWAAPLAVSGSSANGTTVSASKELTVSGGWNGIVSIDPDADGEPIVVELNAGRVSRLSPAP